MATPDPRSKYDRYLAEVDSLAGASSSGGDAYERYLREIDALGVAESPSLGSLADRFGAPEGEAVQDATALPDAPRVTPITDEAAKHGMLPSPVPTPRLQGPRTPSTRPEPADALRVETPGVRLQEAVEGVQARPQSTIGAEEMPDLGDLGRGVQREIAGAWRQTPAPVRYAVAGSEGLLRGVTVGRPELLASDDKLARFASLPLSTGEQAARVGGMILGAGGAIASQNAAVSAAAPLLPAGRLRGAAEMMGSPRRLGGAALARDVAEGVPYDLLYPAEDAGERVQNLALGTAGAFVANRALSRIPERAPRAPDLEVESRVQEPPPVPDPADVQDAMAVNEGVPSVVDAVQTPARVASATDLFGAPREEAVEQTGLFSARDLAPAEKAEAERISARPMDAGEVARNTQAMGLGSEAMDRETGDLLTAVEEPRDVPGEMLRDQRTQIRAGLEGLAPDRSALQQRAEAAVASGDLAREGGRFVARTDAGRKVVQEIKDEAFNLQQREASLIGQLANLQLDEVNAARNRAARESERNIDLTTLSEDRATRMLHEGRLSQDQFDRWHDMAREARAARDADNRRWVQENAPALLDNPPIRDDFLSDLELGEPVARPTTRTPEREGFTFRPPQNRANVFTSALKQARQMDDAALVEAYQERLRVATRTGGDRMARGDGFARANAQSADARMDAYGQALDARGISRPSTTDAYRQIPEREVAERFDLTADVERASMLEDDALLSELRKAEGALRSETPDRSALERLYVLAGAAKDRGLIGDEYGAMQREIARTLAGMGGGAAIGGAVDKESPARGAATGALLGAGVANAPGIARRLRGMDEVGAVGDVGRLKGGRRRAAEPDPMMSGLHNTTAEGLLAADRLGGMPAPSVAVVREGVDFDQYGPITLIGKRSLFDPAQNPVFDADIYSRSYVEPQYASVSYKRVEPLMQRLEPFVREFEDDWGHGAITQRLVDSRQPQPERAIEDLRRSDAARAAFLSERGVPVQAVRRRAGSGTRAADPAIQAFAARYDINARPEEMDAEAFMAAIEEAVRNDGNVPPDLAERIIESARKQYLNDDGKLNYQVDGLLHQARRAAEKGTEVDKGATREAIEQAMKGREQEYEQWLRDQIMPLVGEPFLRRGGRRVPYDLENITAEMTRGPVHGVEKGLVHGEGFTRAKNARRFTDLDDARGAARDHMLGPDEIEAGREAAKQAAESFRNSAANFFRDGQPKDGRSFGHFWEANDAAMEAIAAAGKNPTPATMRRALARAGFKNVPEEIVEQGVEAARALNAAPVPYFEGKPQRAVRMEEEFAGALVPEAADPRVLEVLDRRGIPYRTYGEGQRGEVLSQFRRELYEQGRETLGFAAPEVMRGIARTGAGAAVGGAVDLSQGEDTSPVEGMLLGAGLANAPAMVRRLRGNRTGAAGVDEAARVDVEPIPEVTGPAKTVGDRLWDRIVASRDRLADKVWEKSPAAGNFFFTGHTLGRDWQDLLQARQRKINEGRMVAQELIQRIERFDPAVDRILSQAVDEGDAGAEALRRLQEAGVENAEDAAAIVDDVHSIFEGLGGELVRLKLMSDEAFRKWTRRYAPRLYEQAEGATARVEDTYSPTRRPTRLKGTERLKGRADEPVRGKTPVESLKVRAGTGILQESYLGATEDFFQAVKRNDEWVHPGVRDARDQLTELELARRAADEAGDTAQSQALFQQIREARAAAEQTAKEAKEAGWVQLPKSQKLGSLSEAWVRPDVANEIEGFAKMPSIYGDAADWYLKWLRRWKTGKTVLNPATHGRNIVSAQLLSWMNGGPTPFGREYQRAWGVIRTKRGDLYQQAREHGLFDSSYYSEEIAALGRGGAERNAESLEGVASATARERVGGMVSTGKGKLRGAAGAMADAYHNEDLAARLAYFIHAMEKQGMAPAEAARAAKRYVPTYDNLSNFTKLWSRIGAPFFAYTAKALPLVAESAVRHPLRFIAVGATAHALGELMFTEDVPEEVLPPEMRGPLANTPLPGRLKGAAKFALPTFVPVGDDAEGRRTYLDFTYVMPWGDIAEGRSNNYGPLSGIPSAINPASNPVVSTIGALMANKDPFSGREIASRSMTGGERLRAGADYLYKQAMPSLAPEIPGITEGGWGYQKLRDALTGTPNWYGEVRSVPSAVGDALLGMKQRQIVPAREYDRRLREIDLEMRDLGARISEAMRDPAVPPERKERIRADLLGRMEALRADAQRLFELRPQVPGMR